MPAGEVLPGFKTKRGDDQLGEIVVAFAIFGIGTAFTIGVALVGLVCYGLACLLSLYPC